MFLQGKDDTLSRTLQRNMEKSAKTMDYEAAAGWRDRINALRRVQQHQSITVGSSDIDLITVASLHGKVCVEDTFIRGGRHSGSNGHFPRVPLEFTEGEILSAFITQYYHRRPAPKQIVVGTALPDQKELQQWMTEQSGYKITLTSNVRGARKDWLGMAQLNVVERLKQHISKAENVHNRLLALTKVFELEQTIKRIECFDISHTQGAQTVASCVVFTDKGISKSEYRRYNIKGITPGDDYAAMEQAITRRYKRALKEEAVLPDVLLIDGGKGQLSSAVKILKELQVTGVLLVGVAKGEGRKSGLETLFVEGRKIGIQMPANSPEMHLVTQIRDEAHRFAIAGHRGQRAKSQTQSILQEIQGVGAKRRSALLKHFGGLQGIKSAGIRDLMKVQGINEDLATQIYSYLQNN